jgi:glutamate N-acetyltransferase/amino-acid N-acetyltransferase
VSVTAAKGFVAGGLACGIKESGAPDLALVATDDHLAVPAAAVFTSNLAQAAPVQISRAHLTNGRAAAVVLSSGNANAATGEPGRRDATRMCELTAAGIGAAPPMPRVLDRSHRHLMPMAALEAGIPKLCGVIGADGGADGRGRS